MADTITGAQQDRKTLSKDEEQIVEFSPRTHGENKDLLGELIRQVQAAYVSFLHAQRKIAPAYREGQRHGEQARKAIEEQAANICAETIAKAAQAIVKVEREAEKTYKIVNPVGAVPDF